MSDTRKRFSDIETALCNFFDKVCPCTPFDKEFNSDTVPSFAVFLTTMQSGMDDQFCGRNIGAAIKAAVATRNDAVNFVGAIDGAFLNMRRKIEYKGLTIFLSLQYVSAPVKVLINNRLAYVVSANLRVQVT